MDAEFPFPNSCLCPLSTLDAFSPSRGPGSFSRDRQELYMLHTQNTYSLMDDGDLRPEWPLACRDERLENAPSHRRARPCV